MSAYADASMLDELWISHKSCAPWCEQERWANYFVHAQDILCARITHWDENDPVRRRATEHTPQQLGAYAIQFGPQENSRTIFGILKSIRATLTLTIHRNDPRWPFSYISWHFPPNYYLDEQCVDRIQRLFAFGNESLTPFYSYSDMLRYPRARKTGKIDQGIECELTGVFWLTYFDHHYVDFFGQDNLAALEHMGIAVSLNGGATLRLGDDPASVPAGLRQAAEEFLGPKSFVNPNDKSWKRPGEYALTFDQLRS
jgi:hypothetical protein